MRMNISILETMTLIGFVMLDIILSLAGIKMILPFSFSYLLVVFILERVYDTKGRAIEGWEECLGYTEKLVKENSSLREEIRRLQENK